jgi:hypothetical protein
MAASAGNDGAVGLESMVEELKVRLATVDARHGRRDRLLQGLAMVGTLAGLLTGFLWPREDAPSAGSDVIAASAAAAGTRSASADRLALQMELAQSCLDAGIVDCASFLVDKTLKSQPADPAALKVKAVVAARQAATSRAPGETDPAGSQAAALALADASLGNGQRCIEEKNFDCAHRAAAVVLQNLPDTIAAASRLRQAAERLDKQAQAGASLRPAAPYKSDNSKREVPPPKVPIR